MRIIDTPSPGPTRTLWNQTISGNVIDTEVDLDLPGYPAPTRLYVTEGEAQEIARLYGYVSSDYAKQLRYTIGALETELAAAKRELELARSLNRHDLRRELLVTIGQDGSTTTDGVKSVSTQVPKTPEKAAA